MAVTVDGIQGVFPAAVPSIRITTDGRDLIIHNVKGDKGKLYNLRVRRKDAGGNLISVTEDNKFPEDLIRRVMELGEKLLKPSVTSDLSKNRLWFTTNGNNIKCTQEEIDNEDADDDVDLESAAVLADMGRDQINELEGKGGPAAVLMSEIHCAFFETMYAKQEDGEESSANRMFSPTFVPRIPKPAIKYEETIPEADSPNGASASSEQVSSGRRKASPEAGLPESMRKLLPKSLRLEEETDGPFPASAAGTLPRARASGESLAGLETAGSKDVPKLFFEELDTRDQTLAECGRMKRAPKPESLKHLTYRELHDYSLQKRKQEKDDLYLNYESFKRLLANSGSIEEGDPDLFLWLRHYYVMSYNFHAKYLKHVYAEDATVDPELSSFEEWCCDRAARATVGFIEVPETSGEPLITAIKAAGIPPEPDYR